MTTNTPVCNPTALPIDSQATTLTLPALARKQKCCGDGRLAFFIPWAAITTLGSLTAYGQPGSSLLVEAMLPGLLAGASGLMLYKTTKKLVKYIRRQRILASIRPELAMLARTR